MTLLEIIRLARDMRDSQKRWPMHPQQASIETMALEKRFDEAAAGLDLSDDMVEATKRLTGALMGRTGP